MKNYNFAVVGSGTAGWLTALFLSNNYPWANITVIASSEIGILGAGEGATPHLLNFTSSLGISTEEIIKYCKGTFKNGIKFTNWNGDTRSYFHPFIDEGSLNCFSVTDKDNVGHSAIVLERMINANNLDDCIFSAHASEKNLTKFKPNLELPNPKQILSQYNTLGSYSVHFDAIVLAKFLKRIAVSRRVRYIDDEVEEIIENEDGYITRLITKNKDYYDADFVFDCTGFKRRIIGEHYKAEWKSYAESLPVNRAIPFFIKHDNTEVPPYTEAIAMKYGWVWKIPVEGRFGCGYVFDDKHIDIEQAKTEITEQFGDVEFGQKDFKFEAGRYETPWIKNCIAIGLSAGFIEPLEATSIMTSLLSLFQFTNNNLGNITKDQFYIDKYNENVREFHDDTLDFIYLHYITKRDDTEFWSKFTENNVMPERVKKFMEECNHTIPTTKFLRSINNIYETGSWHSVAKGLRIYNRDFATQLHSAIFSDIRRTYIDDIRASFYMNFDVNLLSLMDHSKLLMYIRESS